MLYGLNGEPVRLAVIVGSTREGRFGGVVADWLVGRVSFPMVPRRFDGDGRPVDADDVNARAETMFDRLLWWACALREARSVQQY